VKKFITICPKIKQSCYKFHRWGEREAGKFSKVLALPGQINAEQISAKLTHGVLTVTVPKAEAQKPGQITVH
jgi:HSP20 family protein